jgi:hypothetical protein
MRPPSRAAACLLALPFLGACGLLKDIGFAPNEADPASIPPSAVPDEPAHVLVQHVLVSFDAAKLPGVTRTREEAKALAEKVLADAKGGRDFADLVRLYSDDTTKEGKLAIANWGVPSASDEIDRQKMVRGFGNLAFSLAVGDVGLLDYDENTSPYGWDVVKRLK